MFSGYHPFPGQAQEEEDKEHAGFIPRLTIDLANRRVVTV